MKQVFRPTYNLLLGQLLLTYPTPKSIILSKENYKKLCREMKHKVKTVRDVKIVNYYY